VEISLPFHSLLGAGLEYLNRSVALISSAIKLSANSVIKLFAKLHREISSQILHNNFPIATTNDPGRTSAIASVTASLVFSRTLPFGTGAYFTCGKSLPNFLRNFPAFSNFHNYFLSGVLALERVGQCLLLFSCFGYNRRKHQSLPWQEK